MSLVNTFLAASLALLSALAQAETIQVPDDCVNRLSPCLVRTAGEPFKFKQNHLEVSVPRDSIIKISQDTKHIAFEILKGRIDIKELEKSDHTLSVNEVLVDSERVMGFRQKDNLQIFSLDDFSLANYKIKKNNFPDRLSSNFLNKNDLVQFTRHYFTQVSQFKKFLVNIEPEWAAEFKQQNETQTKALLRSIASEEKAEEERVKKKIKEENELKKVKSDFFYRTFQR